MKKTVLCIAIALLLLCGCSSSTNVSQRGKDTPNSSTMVPAQSGNHSLYFLTKEQYAQYIVDLKSLKNSSLWYCIYMNDTNIILNNADCIINYVSTGDTYQINNMIDARAYGIKSNGDISTLFAGNRAFVTVTNVGESGDIHVLDFNQETEKVVSKHDSTRPSLYVANTDLFIADNKEITRYKLGGTTEKLAPNTGNDILGSIGSNLIFGKQTDGGYSNVQMIDINDPKNLTELDIEGTPTFDQLHFFMTSSSSINILDGRKFTSAELPDGFSVKSSKGGKILLTNAANDHVVWTYSKVAEFGKEDITDLDFISPDLSFAFAPNETPHIYNKAGTYMSISAPDKINQPFIVAAKWVTNDTLNILWSSNDSTKYAPVILGTYQMASKSSTFQDLLSLPN